MWAQGLATCEGSKRGYHIFFRGQMMSGDRHHWQSKCRYCSAVQQISLVPQPDKNYPKIITTIVYPDPLTTKTNTVNELSPSKEML